MNIKQYSLTEMTSLFQKHIEIQNKKIQTQEVLNYFNHKIRHTYAVLFEAQRILTWEKEEFNNEKIIKKAEIANLLHDIWRLYQNDWKRVLSNNEFEHWDFWFELLKEEGITDLSILFAVKYHNKKLLDLLFQENKFKIQSEEKREEILKVLKITRDADKLQNLEYILFNAEDKLFFRYKEKDEKNNLYTKEVLDSFLNWDLIDSKLIKTQIDYLLLLSSWVFDLNFETSKKILFSSNFIFFIEKNLEKIWLEKNNISEVIEKIKK